MKTATLSGAEFKALAEGATQLRAARVLAERGDRDGAMAALRTIVASLPAPSVEPSQRLRLSAELFLAHLLVQASDIEAARRQIAGYRAMAAQWFPNDESYERQLSILLAELDKVDPAD